MRTDDARTYLVSLLRKEDHELFDSDLIAAESLADAKARGQAMFREKHGEYKRWGYVAVRWVRLEKVDDDVARFMERRARRNGRR
jgi:hypothetical protein